MVVRRHDHQTTVRRIPDMHVGDFTAANLAQHLDQARQDTITDFLQKERKIVATNSDIDWAMTNSPDEVLTAQVVDDVSDVRRQVEEPHRGRTQPTGSDKCQCRKGRSQRNRLACRHHAWVSLKVKAKALGKTLHQIKRALLSDYLRAELKQPVLGPLCLHKRKSWLPLSDQAFTRRRAGHLQTVPRPTAE